MSKITDLMKLMEPDSCHYTRRRPRPLACIDQTDPGRANRLMGRFIWYLTLAWVWIIVFAAFFLLAGGSLADELKIALTAAATAFTVLCAALYKARQDRIRRGYFHGRANRATACFLLPLFLLAWLVALLSFIPSVLFILFCVIYYFTIA